MAFGSGTPFMAKAFAKEFSFTGKLYVDEKRKIYEAMNCKRGIKATLGLKAMASYKRALSEGYKQGASTQGDGLQLGGCFILENGEEVIWKHMEEYAGDHPDPQMILKFLGEHIYIN